MSISHLFVDEAGDLGFSSRSSKFFVVAFLVTDDPFSLSKKLRRLLKRLRARNRYKRDELKFSYASKEIRKKVIEKLAETDINCGEIVVDKGKVNTELRDPMIFYNYAVVHNIMTLVLPLLSDKMRLTIDKSLGRERMKNFNEYLMEKAQYLWRNRMRREEPFQPSRMEVCHVDSQREPGLWAADHLAGAIYNKYEHGNPEYYDVIERKIRYRRFLWEKVN